MRRGTRSRAAPAVTTFAPKRTTRAAICHTVRRCRPGYPQRTPRVRPSRHRRHRDHDDLHRPTAEVLCDLQRGEYESSLGIRSRPRSETVRRCPDIAPGTSPAPSRACPEIRPRARVAASAANSDIVVPSRRARARTAPCGPVRLTPRLNHSDGVVPPAERPGGVEESGQRRLDPSQGDLGSRPTVGGSHGDDEMRTHSLRRHDPDQVRGSAADTAPLSAEALPCRLFPATVVLVANRAEQRRTPGPGQTAENHWVKAPRLTGWKVADSPPADARAAPAMSAPCGGASVKYSSRAV